MVTTTQRGSAELVDQARLYAVLDGVPAMIGYWDTDLRNVLANQAYLEWFGMTPEQIRGRHIREVIGEDLYTRNEPLMRAALAGQAQHFDREIVDAEGVVRYTQSSYLPDIADIADLPDIDDPAGPSVRGMFVLITDVTARRAAELALADEVERVRTVLDAVTDAVISVDLDLRVREMNAAAMALTGRPLAEAAGLPVSQLLSVEDAAGPVDVRQLCLQALATGLTYRRAGTDRLESRSPTAAGTPVDWAVAPVTAADGTYRGVVLAMSDVGHTRQILLDSQHRALHDPLTGLKNRNYLDTCADEIRYVPSSPLSVLFIDLDGFKAVNDTYGHHAGDAVLRQVADLIRTCVRDQDDVIRVGGDEFVVVLRGCPQLAAARMATTIVDRFDRRSFGWRDVSFQIGTSIGVATTEQRGQAALNQAIEDADHACYAAKRAGGYQHAIHDR